jgi:hypothetical protein
MEERLTWSFEKWGDQDEREDIGERGRYCVLFSRVDRVEHSQEGGLLGR